MNNKKKKKYWSKYVVCSGLFLMITMVIFFKINKLS